MFKHTLTTVLCAFTVSAAPALSIAASPKAGPGVPLYPDIVEQISHIHVQNEHRREMLRFSTTHINIGDGPLQIRGGGRVAPCVINGEAFPQCTHSTQEVLDASGRVVLTNPAGVALFHPEHNHWHQNAVALYEVRKGAPNGPALSAGTKTTFCLIDNDQSILVKNGGTRTYFECNAQLQGISVGWGDNYHHSTDGQELDITGTPAGIYYLIHAADPDNHWLEKDKANNLSWVKFELRRQGANPKIIILQQSACTPVTCGTPSNP